MAKESLIDKKSKDFWMILLKNYQFANLQKLILLNANLIRNFNKASNQFFSSIVL